MPFANVGAAFLARFGTKKRRNRMALTVLSTLLLPQPTAPETTDYLQEVWNERLHCRIIGQGLLR